jgi:hypothetical protein
MRAAASTTAASTAETTAKRPILTERPAFPEGNAETPPHHRHHLHGMTTALVTAIFESHVFISFHDVSKIYL